MTQCNTSELLFLLFANVKQGWNDSLCYAVSSVSLCWKTLNDNRQTIVCSIWSGCKLEARIDIDI